MTWNHHSTAACLVACALALPIAVSVQSEDEGRRSPGKDWPSFGGDWTNARHSTLAQITPLNVKTLSGAWTMRFDGNASTRATAVVKDGVMFISADLELIPSSCHLVLSFYHVPHPSLPHPLSQLSPA